MEPERNEIEEEAAEAAIQSRGGIWIKGGTSYDDLLHAFRISALLALN